LADATIVVDPFHIVRLGNAAVTACRQRVQQETLEHRGWKGDPLYDIRKLLLLGRRAFRVGRRGHPARRVIGPARRVIGRVPAGPVAGRANRGASRRVR